MNLDYENTIEETVEKIYPLRSRRKTVDGVEYIYKNYIVYLRYDYMKMFNIVDYMYLYFENGKVYVTSSQPDGSVPMKKLSLHKQNGNPTKKKEKKNEYWKRTFVLPKKFFPDVNENKRVRYTYDKNGFERFSGIPASLTIELID